MWWAPIWRALRFTWRASSPLDQPLRTNHEPSCSLGRLLGVRTACAVAAHWNAPIPEPPVAACAKPYQNAGALRPSVRRLRTLRTETELPPAYPRAAHAPQGSCTESNPTITRSSEGDSGNATIRHPFE